MPLIFMIVFFFNTLNILANEIDLTNIVANIPSQCYTKTTSKDGVLSNPCFSCHRENKIPNYIFDDTRNQESYGFPEVALKNHWINLFKDRSKEVKKISDKKILAYIKENNYKDKNGNIILQKKLKNVPMDWDFNNNGKWDGFIPDCNFNFDNEGFDRNKNGKITGWRAFAYYPFLGTFWPTNGSMDDVLIRLPKIFWKDSRGKFSLKIYKLNLSIIESLIKQKTIFIQKTDEKKYGVDLNQDGKLGISNKIVFKWAVPDYNFKSKTFKNFSMTYVGLTKHLLEIGKIHIAPGLYPKGTEFLHSVRYIDINKHSNIKMAPRMKELRYAKKIYYLNYGTLSHLGQEDLMEDNENPQSDIDKYTTVNIEKGLNNKIGWLYQGFIEDKNGSLRPQNYQETLSCMGCHHKIGAIADSTFSFQRKFGKNTLANGWYHWSQRGLNNIPDKKLENGQTEYVRYLRLNNAGDEFRANKEVMDKFFYKNKKIMKKDLISKVNNSHMVLRKSLRLKEDAIKKLKKDIAYLILPSKKRALALNKAYKIIVNEQSFIYGKIPHIKPYVNVYKKVEDDQPTKLTKILR